MLQGVGSPTGVATLALALLVACAAPHREPPSPSLPSPSAGPPSPAPQAGIDAATWQADTRRLFVALDADSDGLVTLEEIRAGMALLDADGDGWIDSREVRGLLIEDVLPYRLTVEDMARVAGPWLTADLDGDGKLSALELSVSRLREFVLHDRDRDGVLQPGEIQDAVDFPRVRF